MDVRIKRTFGLGDIRAIDRAIASRIAEQHAHGHRNVHQDQRRRSRPISLIQADDLCS